MHCSAACGGFINQGYFNLLSMPITEAILHIETIQELREMTTPTNDALSLENTVWNE